MKIVTVKYFFQLIGFLSLVALMVSLAHAQSGQLGFLSVLTDIGSGGTITSASSGVIEDANQNWGSNSWVGYYIHVTNVHGSGQTRLISANTAKTITVSPAFTEVPDLASTFVIRRGYTENTRGVKLKLYLRYNDGNRSGGKCKAYSCRIQASDTSAVEFVSVEQGNELGKAWTPTYYAPPGTGQMNWLVMPISESQPIASNTYNIATITINLLKTDHDAPLTFSISNCPAGGLPIGISEDEKFIFFDTTSNGSLRGSEEIIVLRQTDQPGHSLASNAVQSPGAINSFPNPFNPTTTIQYALKEYSDVHLVVFDMRGRSVCDLVQGYQFEGIHSIAWEPTNVASGTYLARLTIHGSISNMNEFRTIKLAYTK